MTDNQVTRYELRELGFLALVVPLTFIFAVITTGAFLSVAVETVIRKLR